MSTLFRKKKKNVTKVKAPQRRVSGGVSGAVTPNKVRELLPEMRTTAKRQSSKGVSIKEKAKKGKPSRLKRGSSFFMRNPKMSRKQSVEKLLQEMDISPIEKDNNVIPLPPKPDVCTRNMYDESYLELSSVESDEEDYELQGPPPVNARLGFHPGFSKSLFDISFPLDDEESRGPTSKRSAFSTRQSHAPSGFSVQSVKD